VHSDNGRIDEFESALRKAIELSPNYATSYHWLSNDLRDNILRVGEALEFGEKSRELDPRSRIIGANLAGIYRLLGDFPAAKRETYRVLQLDPGFTQGHGSLASLYRDVGDLDEYIRSTVTYNDLDPGSAFNPAILTIAYVEINSIDAANTVFAPLHEAFPDHVATAWADLSIAAATGDKERIRESLPPLLNSDFGQFFDTVAASGYTLLGDYDLAREAILNSSPMDDLLLPTSWPRFIAIYPEAACLFAWALTQTGDAERGEMLVVEALRHFEELFPEVISHVDRYSPDHGHIAQWNINHRLPLYDPIRQDPRFVAIHERYDRRLAELREAAGL
jgi:tetratricopeptide (TPR) repeat protein